MLKRIGVILLIALLIGSIQNCRTIDLTGLERQEKEIFSEPLWVNYIDGDVYINQEKAEINLPVVEGDVIKTTNEGRVEVGLDRNGFLWLNYNSEVVVNFFNTSLVEISINYGEIYIKTGQRNIEIVTAKEKISLFEAGIYKIRLKDSFLVFHSCLRNEDRFDNFVRERLEQINQSLQEKLEFYGSWGYHPFYGAIWFPNVSPDWSPYLYGRWVWYPYWGWTWISYEPFGWLVFHYGRWQWHPKLGWYWIPNPFYWGPAWVYWYWWDSYIAWCPRWYDYSYYYHFYDFYQSPSRAWRIIRKDQLSRRDISKVVISKNELVKRPSRFRINLNQIKENPNPQRVLNKSIYQKLQKNRIIKQKPPQSKSSISSPSLISRTKSRIVKKTTRTRTTTKTKKIKKTKKKK